jgi:DNA repair exonuclease SbcCD ATPase subunit
MPAMPRTLAGPAETPVATFPVSRAEPVHVAAVPAAATALPPVAPLPTPQRPRRSGAADQVARLAKELTADLSHAAEVNARLRADLDSALGALRAAAEEARQDGIERERIAAESQSRAEAAQRLEEELQLVEAERDGALSQVARLSREVRDEKLRSAGSAEDARKARIEAARAEEEARRLSADLETRAAELEQARTGIEAMRAECDSLGAALLAARGEAEEAARSRTALEEIHRALDEARVRVARIR